MNSKDLNVEIGRRIRAIRESQNKTREQVAESANISAQFLFYIETGKTIINLAKTLNVSTDYILIGAVNHVSKIVNNLEGLEPDKLSLAEEFIKNFFKGRNEIKRASQIAKLRKNFFAQKSSFVSKEISPQC